MHDPAWRAGERGIRAGGLEETGPSPQESFRLVLPSCCVPKVFSLLPNVTAFNFPSLKAHEAPD